MATITRRLAALECRLAAALLTPAESAPAPSPARVIVYLPGSEPNVPKGGVVFLILDNGRDPQVDG
jgi:hypothetical protein